MGIIRNVDGSLGVADGSNITAVNTLTNEDFEMPMPTIAFEASAFTRGSLIWKDLISKSDNERGEYEIHKIEVLVPNKVVRVSFKKNSDYSRLVPGLNSPDGYFKETQQKSICNEKEDEFSLRKGVLVCLAKHLYGDIIVADKIEIIAEQLDWYKEHNKKVTKAIRTYEKKQKALAEKEKREAEEKKRIADKKKRNAEKRRKKRGVNANIDIKELANSMGKMLQEELKRP